MQSMTTAMWQPHHTWGCKPLLKMSIIMRTYRLNIYTSLAKCAESCQCIHNSWLVTAAENVILYCLLREVSDSPFPIYRQHNVAWWRKFLALWPHDILSDVTTLSFTCRCKNNFFDGLLYESGLFSEFSLTSAINSRGKESRVEVAIATSSTISHLSSNKSCSSLRSDHKVLRFIYHCSIVFASAFQILCTYKWREPSAKSRTARMQGFEDLLGVLVRGYWRVDKVLLQVGCVLDGIQVVCSLMDLLTIWIAEGFHAWLNLLRILKACYKRVNGHDQSKFPFLSLRLQIWECYKVPKPLPSIAL